MIVGHLELGPPAAGPARFGRLTADYVEAYTSWDVVRVVVSPETPRPGWREMARAVWQLEAADVAHAQYAPKIWGGGLHQVAALERFTRRVSAPLVVTVHDVVAGPLPPSTRVNLQILGRRATCLVVASRAERQRLVAAGVGAPVEVVPHFIEARGPLQGLGEAKAGLDLEGRRVVTVLGFIHARKGHDLALKALERLGDGTTLVFAGGEVREGPGFVSELREFIHRRGLDARVRITGYLTDPELDMYMAATDVALLPFRDAAASGSLSTWFSAGRPVVASDIPFFREYRRLAPSVIRLVPPEDPAALAAEVERAELSPEIRAEARSLAERYSPQNTAVRLAGLYLRHTSGSP